MDKSTSAETCGTRYNRLCLCVELGLRRLQRGVLWALNMRTIRPWAIMAREALAWCLMEGWKDPEAAPDTDPGELDGESGKTMQNDAKCNK